MKIVKLVWILLVCLLVGAASQNALAQQRKTTMNEYWTTKGKPATPINMKILFFTDGLMNGYGLPDESSSINHKILGQLSRLKIKTKPIVRNMSYDGMTTAIAVTKVKQIIAVQPNLVVFAVGVNDAIKNADTDIIYNNLSIILTELQRAGIYVMVVGIQATPEMGGYGYMSSFNSIYARLTSQFNVPFMPYILSSIDGDPLKFQNNNIFPNAAGAQIVAEDFVKNHLYRVAHVLDEVLFAQYLKYQNNAYKNRMQTKKKVIIK